MNEKIKTLIISKLHELFLSKGKKSPSDEMATLWIKYLKLYPPEELMKAFEKEIMSTNGFPTLGSILNLIDPLPDPESESLDAWNGLLRDISNGEVYTDEQIEICREIAGSLTAIREADPFQLSAHKKDFIRVYSKWVQIKIDEKIQIQTNKNKLLGENHG